MHGGRTEASCKPYVYTNVYTFEVNEPLVGRKAWANGPHAQINNLRAKGPTHPRKSRVIIHQGPEFGPYKDNYSWLP